MNVEWYYAKGEERFGPVSLQELRGLIEGGHVAPDDLVWTSGMVDWRPARDVGELQQPYGLAHDETAPAVYPSRPPTYNKFAIASFVSGLLQLVCCNLLCFAAIALGHVALIQIRTNPERGLGRGFAIAGLVLGYGYLAIAIIWIILMFVGSVRPPSLSGYGP